jgi:hypothetical protein
MTRFEEPAAGPAAEKLREQLHDIEVLADEIAQRILTSTSQVVIREVKRVIPTLQSHADQLVGLLVTAKAPPPPTAPDESTPDQQRPLAAILLHPCENCHGLTQTDRMAWTSGKGEHYEQIRCKNCGIRGPEERNSHDAAVSWSKLQNALIRAAAETYKTSAGDMALIQRQRRQIDCLQRQCDSLVRSNEELSRTSEQLESQVEQQDRDILNLQELLRDWITQTVEWSGAIEAVKDAATELENKIDRHIDAAQESVPP